MSVTRSETTNPRLRAFVLSQYSLMVLALVHQCAISVPHWKANAKKKDRDHNAITAHMARE